MRGSGTNTGALGESHHLHGIAHTGRQAEANRRERATIDQFVRAHRGRLVSARQGHLAHHSVSGLVRRLPLLWHRLAIRHPALRTHSVYFHSVQALSQSTLRYRGNNNKNLFILLIFSYCLF